jgi:hypothetical protein
MSTWMWTNEAMLLKRPVRTSQTSTTIASVVPAKMPQQVKPSGSQVCATQVAHSRRQRFALLQLAMVENAFGSGMRRSSSSASATVYGLCVDTHQLCHFGVVVADGLFQPARLDGCSVSKVSAA